MITFVKLNTTAMEPIDKELLIARNEFCKNPETEAYFKKYFTLLLKCEKTASDPSLKYSFLQQADTVLSLFCEKAALDDKVIARIDKYHSDLDVRFAKLESLSASTPAADDPAVSTTAANDASLRSLTELKKEMSAAKTQAKFDKCLKRLAELDAVIDKDSLTQKQRKKYDTLTEAFSKVVSDKVNRFNAQKEREYNAAAISEFHTVYFNYKKDEKKYKELNEATKALVGRLFNFNSSSLTTEVLVYYNHVYSYIFSKLNDEEKFELTQMSLKRFDAE